MKKLTLLLSLLLALTINVFATHNLGGDISFNQISSSGNPNRYGITIRTYTNTNNTQADRCELTVHFGDGDSAIFPRVNGPSGLCPSTADGQMLGGYTNVKYNLYYAEHVFPGAGTYTITMEDMNHSTGICNVPNSASTPFSLEATLIISSVLGTNSAPQYVSVPITYDNINVVAYYNPNVTEADGDSLYYELVPPLGAPGYTYPAFSNYFYIDVNTGTVTWDVPTMICLFVYDIKISEFRRVGTTYYPIGSTRQEIWNEVGSFPAGVNDLGQSGSLLYVFPNPASNEINFTIDNKMENENYSMNITNSLGQFVKHIDFINNSKAILSIEDIHPGIYFYSLNCANHSSTKGKFIVISPSY